jgi:hypothetical protein
MKVTPWMLGAVLVIAAGCNHSNETRTVNSTPSQSEYLTTSEPANAVPVGKARESVMDDQPVTLIGTIGGSPEPFVAGLAAFTIVDPKVPYCPPEEGCPTPWDYCCTQDQVKDNIATVKIVDKSGNPVESDARQLLGAKELSTVVVQGTAQRDAEGNLTVAATKVFVQPSG